MPYNEVLADDSIIPATRAAKWADFKARYQQALQTNLGKPFTLPNLADRDAIFAYDRQLSAFLAEVQTYEGAQ